MSLGNIYVDFIFKHKDMMQLITSDNTYRLSKIEIMLLLYIKRFKNPTMGDVSNFFELPQSTTLFIVNKLIKLGLIVREKKESDRRVVIVTQSPLGEDVTSQLLHNTTVQFIKILDIIQLESQNFVTKEEAFVLNNLFQRLQNIE